MSPIRVDFYLLSDTKTENKLLIACRLLEKAYHRKHRVYVVCDNQEAAEQFDEMLWTFKEEAFIPHNIQGEGLEPPPPIQIGFQKEPRGYDDILLNLSAEIPAYFLRFRRIIELVEPDENAKARSRQRYRDYRAQACDIHTHALQSA